MRALAISMMLLLVPALLLNCGSDVSTFGNSGGGGTTDGGGGTGASSTGGMGGGAVGGAGGMGGSEPLCDDFGQPCTSCLATSELCQDEYCGCLASAPCATFWQCALNCGGDTDCFDDCELNNAEGYADYFKVRDCMGQDCSDACMGVMPLGGCFNCLLDDCEGPLEGCQGDASCNEYLDCTAGCQDFACVTGCYAAVPDSTEVNALLNCSDAQCSDPGECEGFMCQGFGDPCTDCAFAAPSCNGAYCDCVGDTTCLGLSSCYNGCQPNDEACADACEATWFNGYGDYLLMLSCMGDSCSQDCGGVQALPTCTVCLASQCEAELEGCLGDADCNEYLDCVGACTNPGCELGCYTAAMDTTAIDALGVCLTGTCGADCN
jgi:hypothetical protein